MGRENGFTLIELAVAALIMATIMVAMGDVLTNSLLDAAYNRQRVEAVNLANQTVEEVRALASTSSGWNTIVTIGQTTDPDTTGTPSPAADPNVVAAGTGYCFEGQPLDIGGKLVAGCSAMPWQDRSKCNTTAKPPDAGSLSGSQPLEPHEACYILDNNIFIVDTYLTGVNIGRSPVILATPATLTLTVVVSWTHPLRGAAGTAADRVSTTTQLAGCSVQLPCT
jgi:prepilin-type N-terminal cleavage/methylation domain-containing protein